MKKLVGWKRVWMNLSLLWLVPICLFMWGFMPRPEQAKQQALVKRAWETAIIIGENTNMSYAQRVKFADDVVRDVQLGLNPFENMSPEIRVRFADDVIRDLKLFVRPFLEVNIATFENFPELMGVCFSELDFSPVEQAYRDRLREMDSKVVMVILTGLLYWFVPVVWLYSVGWVISRARRDLQEQN